MRFLSRLFVLVLPLVCAPAWALIPAGGLWGINAELNGSPGRGFQLEVENETVVFTYYGYRADGSSMFYLASGPLFGNVFTAALTEYRGGTPIGAAYRPGQAAATVGVVRIDFTTGKTGTITLPNEAPKAVSKFSFGYPNTPQALKGTYMMGYSTGSEFFGDHVTLVNVIPATTNGSGVVTNANYTFGCEHLVSGPLVGQIICVDATNSQYDDSYFFKMSGDTGSGVGTWKASQTFYPAVIQRVAYASGRRTGINDGTLASLDKRAPTGTAAHFKALEAAAKANSMEHGASAPAPAEAAAVRQAVQALKQQMADSAELSR